MWAGCGTTGASVEETLTTTTRARPSRVAEVAQVVGEPLDGVALALGADDVPGADAGRGLVEVVGDEAGQVVGDDAGGGERLGALGERDAA